jgi:murein DD-endopeptidase MepM/ murein hydrolase activator NlpD
VNPAAASPVPRFTAPVTPILSKPFEGEHPVSGLYDHRRPGDRTNPDPGTDNDHRQLTAWNSLTWGKAGHQGYDWPMDVGTPILAAAAGVVEMAGDVGPTECGKRTAETDVRVRLIHRIEGDGGERTFLTGYIHLSEARVRPGESVEAGQVIGLSGNSGCSSGPPLHFSVLEQIPGRARPRTIDPYGWDATVPDPTDDVPFKHAEWLWRDGEAPLIFRPMGPSQYEAFGDLRITNLRGMAWQDDRHPNNEFVQLSVRRGGPRKVSLDGWRIRSVRSNLSYRFDSGVVVRRGQPLRLYTGVGEDSEDTVFWGRAQGVYVDEGDCIELIDPRGDVMHLQHQGRRADDWCKNSR